MRERESWTELRERGTVAGQWGKARQLYIILRTKVLGYTVTR
jgi:hypothetical protein